MLWQMASSNRLEARPPIRRWRIDKRHRSRVDRASALIIASSYPAPVPAIGMSSSILNLAGELQSS